MKIPYLVILITPSGELAFGYDSVDEQEMTERFIEEIVRVMREHPSTEPFRDFDDFYDRYFEDLSDDPPITILYFSQEGESGWIPFNYCEEPIKNAIFLTYLAVPSP